jgi:hypothetical protein
VRFGDLAWPDPVSDARGTPIFAPTAPNDSLVWGGVQQMLFDPPQFVE